ncbi:winged helix-turn-helix transcriptional regulator [Candidatus Dependentiae bacterium]|nr:winged helix-turn-helix transcriptional regulator [Candidatus Dependentiae bacterium]
MSEVSKKFKVFSNRTRLRILNLLKLSPMYVNFLSEVMKIYQSKLSHQLLILKQAKLVKAKKKGKVVTYSLHITNEYKTLFKLVSKSFLTEKVFIKDIEKAKKKLKRL